LGKHLRTVIEQVLQSNMASTPRLVGLFFPLILVVLAMAFSLTATTSKDWAYQRNYPAEPITNYTHPLYTLHRSPFVLCTLVDDQNAVQCAWYPPFGKNRTSCELASAIDSTDNVTQLGDPRLCQQVHMAGNLAIAGTLFIGLGFLLTIGMTMASITLLSRVSGGSPSSSPLSLAAVVAAAEGGDATTEEDNVDAALPAHKSGAASSEHRPHHHGDHQRKSVVHGIAPFVNAFLITFLALGGTLYLLAQYYGILAFTMSLPDNGVFSEFGGNNPDATAGFHEPWVQGKALTTWASLAWFFAALGAAAASMAWKLPELEVYL
jgi:hypothetical protein